MLFSISADGNIKILHVLQISGNFGIEHITKYPVFSSPCQFPHLRHFRQSHQHLPNLVSQKLPVVFSA